MIFFNFSSSIQIIGKYSYNKINDVGAYTKIYIVEPMCMSLKFYRNASICLNLTKYFHKKYNVKCHIPMLQPHDTSLALNIKLSGFKNDVKNACDDLRALFEAIKVKTFNNEDTDKKGNKNNSYIPFFSDSKIIFFFVFSYSMVKEYLFGFISSHSTTNFS